MKVFAPKQTALTERSNFFRKCTKRIARGICMYGLYLLLLGPYWSMDGRGFLDFIPSAVREVAFIPALIPFHGNILGSFYGVYLDLWYQDPNSPETTG